MAETKRIAQISDLHFGQARSALVEALISELHAFSPDLIVVTGDITQRGRASQFRLARAFFDQLPFSQLIVPGNHDIAPIYRPWRRARRPFENYKRFMGEALNRVHVDDSVLVLGLNTAAPLRWSEGWVSNQQLHWVYEQRALYPDRLLVVAAHHPLVRPEGGSRVRVRGKSHTWRALEVAGARVLLAGHLHETFSGPAAARVGAEESLLLVQASTATSTRLRGHLNAYNRIHLGQHQARIEVRVAEQQHFCTQRGSRFRDEAGAWRGID